MYAAGDTGTYHPVELTALVPGQLLAAEQHRDPPRLGAASRRGGQLAQRGVLAGQDCLVDPADLFHQVVQEPAKTTRADEGEQPGRAQRGESGQPTAEPVRVVADQPDVARRGPTQAAQQQRGDHGRAPVSVPVERDVPGVEQRHKRRYRRGAGQPDGADPRRPRRLGPLGRGRAPPRPVRRTRAGRLPGRRLGRLPGQHRQPCRVPGIDLGEAAVAFGPDPLRHTCGGLAYPHRPLPGGGQRELGSGRPVPGRAKCLGEQFPDPGDQLVAPVSHRSRASAGRWIRRRRWAATVRRTTVSCDRLRR
ncbi:hypothetical protein GCM10029963_14800 [Micromonospora andamanensis]